MKNILLIVSAFLLFQSAALAQETPVKLYVGNLSYSTSEEGLKELFSSFGEVISVSYRNGPHHR